MSSFLITGGSRGIGRAAALALGGPSARVAVTYKTQLDAAESCCEEIAALGGEARCFVLDLEDEDSIAKCAGDVSGFVDGSLDGLALNAAATAFRELADIRPRHLRRTFEASFFGSVDLFQRLLPALEASPLGRVVGVSGEDVRCAIVGHAALASANAALETFFRYAAVELGRRLRFYVVSPGWVSTDSLRFMLGDERFERGVALEERFAPIRSAITADDVGGLVADLLRQGSDLLNGSLLSAAGGSTFAYSQRYMEITA